MPQNFTSLQSLYGDNRARVYDLPPVFTTRSVRHSCLPSLIRFYFAFEVIVKIGLSSYERSGINIYSDSELCDFEYADKVVLLSESPAKVE